MASRIIFLPNLTNSDNLFEERVINFEWVPGIAVSQARKSIKNFHEAAIRELNLNKILEVSTRSEVDLGIMLSAFNLKLPKGECSVEAAYHASKVFEFGGPYLDLLRSSSSDAKKDLRLKSSGNLIGFRREVNFYPVSKSPNFYDLLYIESLLNFKSRKDLQGFDAFTDIAFNQISLKYDRKKSYNCQARSVSIYLTLISKYQESEIIDRLTSVLETNQTQASQLGLF